MGLMKSLARSRTNIPRPRWRAGTPFEGGFSCASSIPDYFVKDLRGDFTGAGSRQGVSTAGANWHNETVLEFSLFTKYAVRTA